jgi:hypothetical protein
MVVLFRNPWFIGNLDILTHGTLAAISWLSICAGKPFVLQYALETVPPERRASPAFYRICRNLTMVWGVIFMASTGMSAAEDLRLVDGRVGFSGGLSWLDRVGPVAQPLVSPICASRWDSIRVQPRQRKNTSLTTSATTKYGKQAGMLPGWYSGTVREPGVRIPVITAT